MFAFIQLDLLNIEFTSILLELLNIELSHYTLILYEVHYLSLTLLIFIHKSLGDYVYLFVETFAFIVASGFFYESTQRTIFTFEATIHSKLSLDLNLS